MPWSVKCSEIFDRKSCSNLLRGVYVCLQMLSSSTNHHGLLWNHHVFSKLRKFMAGTSDKNYDNLKNSYKFPTIPCTVLAITCKAILAWTFSKLKNVWSDVSEQTYKGYILICIKISMEISVCRGVSQFNTIPDWRGWYHCCIEPHILLIEQSTLKSWQAFFCYVPQRITACLSTQTLWKWKIRGITKNNIKYDHMWHLQRK